MKTITINLYSFDELSKEVKQKALEKYSYINVEHDWWHGTYEDAKNIGLKITGFDLGRNKHAKGKFLLSANDVADNIIKNHGESCNTYSLAVEFLAAKDNMSTEEENLDLETLEETFLDYLLEAYANMLQEECDYLQSEEAVLETFEANDYTFEENGKMNNS